MRASEWGLAALAGVFALMGALVGGVAGPVAAKLLTDRPSATFINLLDRPVELYVDDRFRGVVGAQSSVNKSLDGGHAETEWVIIQPDGFSGDEIRVKGSVEDGATAVIEARRPGRTDMEFFMPVVSISASAQLGDAGSRSCLVSAQDPTGISHSIGRALEGVTLSGAYFAYRDGWVIDFECDNDRFSTSTIQRPTDPSGRVHVIETAGSTINVPEIGRFVVPAEILAIGLIPIDTTVVLRPSPSP